MLALQICQALGLLKHIKKGKPPKHPLGLNAVPVATVQLLGRRDGTHL